MGQTSELDEEKSSVLVLPDATAKDTDDIPRGLCVGGGQMTRDHNYSGLSQHLLLSYIL